MLERGLVLSATDVGFEPRDPTREAAFEATFPLRGEGAIRLFPHRGGGPPVELVEESCAGAGALDGRAVRYANGRGWSYWTVDERGAEEWLLVNEPPPDGDPIATWRVDPLTLVERSGEVFVVDPADGHALLRVSAPDAVTLSGAHVPARVADLGGRLALYADLHGERGLVDPQWVLPKTMHYQRTRHVGAVLPGGSSIMAGGITQIGNSVVTATVEVYDTTLGAWLNAPPLQAPRQDAVAAALPDGRVIVTGGATNSAASSAATDLYAPATGAWTVGPPLPLARYDSTATTLADGRILVAGGYTGSALSTRIDIFDGASNSWTTGASPSTIQLRYHTATLLQNGDVLMTGGNSTAVRIYKPSTNTWTSAASSAQIHARGASALLPSGDVLVAGGAGLAAAEKYRPATNTWSAAGSMSNVRTYFDLKVLPDGKVLAAGGDSGSNAEWTTDIYDPATNTWTVGPHMSTSRARYVSLSLPNGGIQICGGQYFTDAQWDTCETFATDQGQSCSSDDECVSGYCESGVCCDTPCGGPCETCAANQGATKDGICTKLPTPACTSSPPIAPWTAVSPMIMARGDTVAAPIPGEKILLFGGDTNPFTEIYDSVAGVSAPAAPVTGTCLDNARAVTLADGKVLVIGCQATRIYDPASDAWTVSSPNFRFRGSLTLLADGRALAVGGGSLLDSAEIYDPATSTWSPIPGPNFWRREQSAVLLGDGRVFVVGGEQSIGASATAEIYDPISNAWAIVASAPRPMFRAAIARLASGKVLLVGAHDSVNPTATSYLYDPATNVWSSAGETTVPRYSPDATVLSDGRVIVTGGTTDALGAKTDLYDPVTNRWYVGPQLNASRVNASIAKMSDGRIYAFGGSNASQSMATSSVDRLTIYGAACATSATCPANQTCVDGVCCNQPCNAGVCDACSVATGALYDGICRGLSGPTCDDGDVCTQTDKCMVGVCVGKNPLSCTSLDQCHTANACNPSSGCSVSAVPDGTPCVGGQCMSGLCVQTSTSAAGSTAASTSAASAGSSTATSTSASSSAASTSASSSDAASASSSDVSGSSSGASSADASSSSEASSSADASSAATSSGASVASSTSQGSGGAASTSASSSGKGGGGGASVKADEGGCSVAPGASDGPGRVVLLASILAVRALRRRRRPVPSPTAIHSTPRGRMVRKHPAIKNPSST
ncbi:MAG: kelch repeat-containing protein [Polyangiaceae bacterium]